MATKRDASTRASLTEIFIAHLPSMWTLCPFAARHSETYLATLSPFLSSLTEPRINTRFKDLISTPPTSPLDAIVLVVLVLIALVLCNADVPMHRFRVRTTLRLDFCTKFSCKITIVSKDLAK